MRQLYCVALTQIKLPSKYYVGRYSSFLALLLILQSYTYGQDSTRNEFSNFRDTSLCGQQVHVFQGSWNDKQDRIEFLAGAEHWQEEGFYSIKDKKYYQMRGTINFNKKIILKQCLGTTGALVIEKEVSINMGDISYEGAVLQEGYSFESQDYQGTVNYSRAVFKGNIDFRDIHFLAPLNLSHCTFKKNVLVRSTFNAEVNLFGACFNGNVNINNAFFNNRLILDSVRFLSSLYIEKVHFTDSLSFVNCYLGNVLQIKDLQNTSGIDLRRTIFRNDVRLTNIHITGDIVFSDIVFDDKTNIILNACEIDGSVRLSNAKVFGQMQITKTNIKRLLDISNTVFYGELDLRNTILTERPNIQGAVFNKVVHVKQSGLIKGIDFTNAVINDVVIVELESNSSKSRELIFNWDNIRDDRIVFSFADSASHEKNFKLVENILYAIRDTFIQKGMIDKAEEVKYDLQRRKVAILGKWTDKLLWTVFPPGRFPWIYLISILFFIVSFTFYYAFNRSSYTQIHDVMYKSKQYYGYYYPKRAYKRYIQCIVFSTGILFGIRFKPQWIEGGNIFVSIILFQWFLGKMLLLLPVMFISVNYPLFDFIKKILGL